VKRVVVMGGSCSGKTTLARRLAGVLDVPHVELDALHHGPNWNEAPPELLQERVRAAFAIAPEGWVVDGNYLSKLDDLVLERADTAVVLDPPFATALRRALVRTFRRVVTREELWNGNRERVRDAFSRYSIPLWVVRTHRGYPDRLLEHVRRHAHLDVVVLGTAREIDAWLQSIQASASTSGSSSASTRQKTPPLAET
jgi:adenylate kinase family enzyme